MHHMTFFNLGPKDRGMLFENGARVTIDEVFHAAEKREVGLWRKHNLPSRFVPSGFEPTPHMMAAVQALCIALSGCEASVHDLKNIRRFMYRVPNEYKRSFSASSQIAPFLAYLLVGFRMHPSDDHKEDSNSVRDLADFAVDLASTHAVHLTSFLCAHRGPSVPGGSWLATSLPEDQVRRALHLELGILTHLPNVRSQSITWRQQGPSPWAADTIFPELFLRYVESGRVGEMLLELGRQEQLVRRLMMEMNPTSIPVRLQLIDPFLDEIERFLAQRYGAEWRTRDFRIPFAQADALSDLAVRHALPEVNRLLSFRHVRSGPTGKDEVERWIRKNQEALANIPPDETVPDLVHRTKDTIQRYVDHERMHPTAKAVFDAAFSYLWGRECSLGSGRFAMGLDRDHSLHQREAWRLGQADQHPRHIGHGVVYARRSDAIDHTTRYLNTLSFRQFWR